MIWSSARWRRRSKAAVFKYIPENTSPEWRGLSMAGPGQFNQYGPGGVALRRAGNQNGLSTTVAFAIARDQCISRW
jgi:hypothetical protein